LIILIKRRFRIHSVINWRRSMFWQISWNYCKQLIFDLPVIFIICQHSYSINFTSTPAKESIIVQIIFIGQ